MNACEHCGSISCCVETNDEKVRRLLADHSERIAKALQETRGEMHFTDRDHGARIARETS